MAKTRSIGLFVLHVGLAIAIGAVSYNAYATPCTKRCTYHGCYWVNDGGWKALKAETMCQEDDGVEHWLARVLFGTQGGGTHTSIPGTVRMRNCTPPSNTCTPRDTTIAQILDNCTDCSYYKEFPCTKCERDE